MNKNKQVFLYASCFVPIIIIFIEVSLAIFTNVAGIKIPHTKKKFDVEHIDTFDLITGTNRYKLSKKDLQNKNSFINRHGLIKTIYTSNKDNLKNIRGVAVLGNSVALGYPVTNFGNYKKTFVNLLEKELRLKDKSIDIVNLSNYGFNSWHENVQLVKYFNSKNNFYDLPDIKLVASLGGIQDFWSFINFLTNKDPIMKEFHSANGLMSLRSKEEILFFNTFDKASKGNIGSGLKIFLNSIFRNIKTNSYINGYLRILKKQKNKIIKPKTNLEVVNSSVNTKSIAEIISKKLNITMDQYNYKKNSVINSVLRNYQSMIAINPEGEFLFIYLPTKFGFSNQQRNISERFQYKGLNVSDLNLLESDYRLSLIKSLKEIEKLHIYNLADQGTLDWFYDESHYTINGHENLAEILSPIFSKLLERNN